MDTSPILGGNAVLQKYGYLNPTSVQSQQDSNENLFLDLLVTQLKNQNPLEPMENNEFVQQMSALAAVQETQSLNANIQSLIQLQEVVAGQNAFTQSANLVGKNVDYVDPETGDEKSGYVDSIHLAEGGIFLSIGGTDVPMSLVTGISAAADDAGQTAPDDPNDGADDGSKDDSDADA